MAAVESLMALGSKYSVEMLTAADEPSSAQELSDRLDIPIATCYRRLDDLQEADLIELHDRILADDRQRVGVYRRSVDSVHVFFENGDVEVRFEERSAIETKLDDAWRNARSD